MDWSHAKYPLQAPTKGKELQRLKEPSSKEDLRVQALDEVLEDGVMPIERIVFHKAVTDDRAAEHPSPKLQTERTEPIPQTENIKPVSRAEDIDSVSEATERHCEHTDNSSAAGMSTDRSPVRSDQGSYDTRPLSRRTEIDSNASERNFPDSPPPLSFKDNVVQSIDAGIEWAKKMVPDPDRDQDQAPEIHSDDTSAASARQIPARPLRRSNRSLRVSRSSSETEMKTLPGGYSEGQTLDMEASGTQANKENQQTTQAPKQSSYTSWSRKGYPGRDAKIVSDIPRISPEQLQKEAKSASEVEERNKTRTYAPSTEQSSNAGKAHSHLQIIQPESQPSGATSPSLYSRSKYPLQAPASRVNLQQEQRKPAEPNTMASKAPRSPPPSDSESAESKAKLSAQPPTEHASPKPAAPRKRGRYPLQAQVSTANLQSEMTPPSSPDRSEHEADTEKTRRDTPRAPSAARSTVSTASKSSFRRKGYPLQEPASMMQLRDTSRDEVPSTQGMSAAQKAYHDRLEQAQSSASQISQAPQAPEHPETPESSMYRRKGYPASVASVARDEDKVDRKEGKKDTSNKQSEREAPEDKKVSQPEEIHAPSYKRGYPLSNAGSSTSRKGTKASAATTNSPSVKLSDENKKPQEVATSPREQPEAETDVADEREKEIQSKDDKEHKEAKAAEGAGETALQKPQNKDQEKAMEQSRRETHIAKEVVKRWKRQTYPLQSIDEKGHIITPDHFNDKKESEKPAEPIRLPKNIRAVKDATHTEEHSGRTIVILLDGTGDKFDDDNSNIVHLVAALKKDDARQVSYYQAGIGTYGKGGLSSGFEAAADMAVGSGLGLHIRDAYHFLMHSYKEGDKICIFGFSRGAYTARCLAGMIHKVGLLPPRNIQQIEFAYEFYKDTTAEGWRNSAEFKETFSIECSVYFLGCFDSVASVGIYPRQLPLSSTPYNKPRYFRHAMALDERRAKFKVCRHQTAEFDDLDDPVEAGVEDSLTAKARESKDIANSKNSHTSSPKPSPTSSRAPTWSNDASRRPGLTKTLSRRSYGASYHPNLTEDEYQRLTGHESPFDTDVLEVWFAGCHSDVGGGAVKNTERHKLAQIPLRWMIRQAFDCDTGIIFKTKSLAQYGLDIHTLWPKYSSLNTPVHGPPPSYLERFRDGLPSRENRMNKLVPVNKGDYHSTSHKRDDSKDFYHLLSHTDEDWTPEQVEDYFDALTPLHDQLVLAKNWWLLEFYPVEYRVPVGDSGEVKMVTGMNLGRYRGIEDVSPNLHWTVKMREEQLGYKIGTRMSKSSRWNVVV